MDEFWKDVDFGFIGLDFPSDDEKPGKSKKKAAKEAEGVYLNKKHFMQTKKAVEASHKRGYASGWSTKTNKAVAHTVTHELAHATWNANMTGANQKAAGKEVNKLFKSWKKDNKKSGYGKYAETNVSEFWAETVTKAIHGKSDKYTKKVKEICKKYKL